MMYIISADAPQNELKLFKFLLQYKVVNNEKTVKALSVLKRHLFYITEENALFSLFSNRVGLD